MLWTVFVILLVLWLKARHLWSALSQAGNIVKTIS